jgi:hypothetical protein
MNSVNRSILIVALAAIILLAGPVHAQNPIIDSSARLRTTALTAGQNLGVVALVVGLLGLMATGGHHDSKQWFVTAIVAGACLWGVSALIATLIT